MASSTNIGGAWKQISKMWCNISGTWRQVAKAHCNIGGAWRQWFSGADGVYLYKEVSPSQMRTINLINYDNYTVTGEQYALAPEASMVFLSSEEAFFSGYSSNASRTYGIGKFDISTGAELSVILPSDTVDIYGGACGCSENYIYTKATDKLNVASVNKLILQLDKSTLALISYFNLVGSPGGFARQVTGSAGQLFCSDHQSGTYPGWWDLTLRDEASKSLIKGLASSSGGSSGSKENFQFMGCDKRYFYSRRGGYSAAYVIGCGKYDRNTVALISELLGVNRTEVMSSGNVDGFKN